MDEKHIAQLEAHLKRTFGNPHFAVKARKQKARPDPYAAIISYFDGGACDLMSDATDKVHAKSLAAVPGLVELVQERHAYLDAEERLLWAEFVLHGLAEHSRIGRSTLQEKVTFSDLFQAMLGSGGEDDLEEGDDERS